MYTASVTIGHCNMHLSDRGATPTDIANYIDAINALDDANDSLRWATFSKMVEIWRTDYQEQPSLWNPD
jgi:hypothetical protein